MKTITIQIRLVMQLTKIIVVFLGIGFFELQAQNSPTDIIPVGSTVTKLSSIHFDWAEGPVWYNDSILLFVDDNITNGSNIYQYNPVTKQFSKWPSNSSGCGGLACDKDGNLIATSYNIIMMNKAGQVIKTLASGYNGKPFNGPNDLIADDKGGVYFTDPAYFVPNPPQDKKAVYYIDPTGSVKRIIDEFDKPNGIILSPDGKKLYLEVPDSTYVYSWNVAADGSVSGRSQFALLHTLGGLKSESDGIAIDINGNIYVADNMGVEVFSNSGEYITTILVPEKPSNCDFGGKDFKTLYITAVTSLYSIDLNFPGYTVSRQSLPTGINQISSKPMVGIYPNPVTDILHVQLNEGKVKTIEILNTVGKMESISMKSLAGTDVEINTQNLKPGIYMLRIVCNKRSVTKQFVKK